MRRPQVSPFSPLAGLAIAVALAVTPQGSHAAGPPCDATVTAADARLHLRCRTGLPVTVSVWIGAAESPGSLLLTRAVLVDDREIAVELDPGALAAAGEGKLMLTVAAGGLHGVSWSGAAALDTLPFTCDWETGAACGVWASVHTVEACNGTDDDCDLLVDEDAFCPDDGVACTAEACSGALCLSTPSDALCNDGRSCTIDTCSAVSGCFHADTCGGSLTCCQAGCVDLTSTVAHCGVCDTACPGADTECQSRSCTAGACGFVFTPTGQPVTSQTAGDCQLNVCDGTGGEVAVADNTDLPDDGNQCTDDLCTGGAASNLPSPAGTPCNQNGGSICDGSGACIATAEMVINEVNPNISTSRDLVELLVISAGTTMGITLVQDGSVLDTLATMPDVTVAVGDLIVVHLNPTAATGAAPASETVSKTQFPAAMYSANYDGAWDFHGGTTGLTFSHRVLRVEAPGGGSSLDAVPFVLSTTVSPPAAFPGDLQALQAAGRWLPADCGGSPCSYTSTPTAVGVSVDYNGCGTSPTGNSVARQSGQMTMQKGDWNAAATPSWGVANP